MEIIIRPPVVKYLTDKSVSGIPAVVTADVWSGPCLVGIVMRLACVIAVGVEVAVREYSVVESLCMLVAGIVSGWGMRNAVESRITRLELVVNVPIFLLMSPSASLMISG